MIPIQILRVHFTKSIVRDHRFSEEKNRKVSRRFINNESDSTKSEVVSPLSKKEDEQRKSIIIYNP